VKKRVSYITVFGLLLLCFEGSGAAVPKPRKQSVKITVTEKGFEPVALRLKKGIPAQLTFVRTTDATCAKEIVVPEFNINRALPLNERVVVVFTPKKRGTYSFVCGMDMMRGQLIVQ
jgi:plastocyanin domain-containing protein